jgi:hypothetical protein
MLSLHKLDAKKCHNLAARWCRCHASPARNVVTSCVAFTSRRVTIGAPVWWAFYPLGSFCFTFARARIVKYSSRFDFGSPNPAWQRLHSLPSTRRYVFSARTGFAIANAETRCVEAQSTIASSVKLFILRYCVRSVSLSGILPQPPSQSNLKTAQEEFQLDSYARPALTLRLRLMLPLHVMQTLPGVWH